MSTSGKAPTNRLVSRNHAANFRRRENVEEKGSTSKWKPSKEKIEGKLGRIWTRLVGNSSNPMTS
jgi:hypothetical protein